MAHRNRSTGWKHAKLSGHENEERVKALLDSDPVYAHQLLTRIGHESDELAATSIGGLHETNVPSICGRRKTKSKTDLKLFLKRDASINISVKKSLHGQVYFVRAGRFIEIFEGQFGKPVPPAVQRGIKLFWAAADDAVAIIEKHADRANEKDYDLQIRHKSLNAATLRAYDGAIYDSMLAWFKENAYEIALLCFAMGAAKDEAEWAQYVWYKNMMKENETDDILAIKDICIASQRTADQESYYSHLNGGTTIQLPFGFVQWHQKQLQFHHNYEKIKKIL